MKIYNLLRQLAVIAFIIIFSVAAAGQTNVRQSRRNDQQSRENTRSERIERTQSRSITSKVERSESSSRNQNSRRQAVSSGRVPYSGESVQERHRGTQDPPARYNNKRPGKGHSQKHIHQKAPSYRPNYHPSVVRVQRPPQKKVYYRHLPTIRVNRFQYRGRDYIYSGNYFYRYHPNRGFVVVNVPFRRAKYLPPYYSVRVVNGHPYVYYNGFVYLPFEYGYVMVPVPARPHISLNVAVGF